MQFSHYIRQWAEEKKSKNTLMSWQSYCWNQVLRILFSVIMMSDWDDFIVIAPVFLAMGIACIAAYLAPYILGKIDDWKKDKIKS